jgi:putative glutamine amidotransferase
MHGPAKSRCSRPLRIGVIGDLQCVGTQMRYTVERTPVETVARVLKTEPVVLPPLEDAFGIDDMLARVDGVLIPGGVTNIHPSRYGKEVHKGDGPFDEARDGFVLPLIPQIVARGMPLLGTCRGLQEMNVAFGGTLRKEPDDQPEEQKHGTPASARTENDRFRLRHNLNVRHGGLLWRVLQTKKVLVNSLHSFLIEALAPELEIEATADDGTIEAARPRNAPGFALAVMFHPEYWAQNDPTSAAILHAFASAVRAYADARQLEEASA